jgi:hypothetical protein
MSIQRHHRIAKSRGGTEDDWNLVDKTEYDHTYDHALDFVLFENAPAFDFRLPAWNFLPEDLKEAVRKEKARRTALHNQSDFMREVTVFRNKTDNPILKPGAKEKAYTENRNQKISESLTGHKKTESHRENLSGENNGMYGRTGESNPFFGQSHSPETKQKMSQAKKGKPWSDARRKAFQEAKVNGDS